ncbi:helix-turn-helix domain-containing protein [Methylobacterium indicum]|uniref:helix-turn-helix domain-containing protein n=1 Tax=Methylobacterium indicum TaxID=1775910 RepID=UPI002435B6B5|nr:helix-turn-helix transcriptional regulator [Methylobacterium indicum]
MDNFISSRPFENTSMAQYLRQRIEEMAKKNISQRELAIKAGYDKPNIISMFKRGETKVPFDKVPALAEALEVDLIYLMRLQMEQPGMWDPGIINKMVGRISTENEFEVLNSWRMATNGRDIKLNKKQLSALTDAMKLILKSETEIVK